jgi:ArsC family
MSEGEALDALASDSKLIERPLLLGSGIALVGFDEPAFRRALGWPATGHHRSLERQRRPGVPCASGPELLAGANVGDGRADREF